MAIPATPTNDDSAQSGSSPVFPASSKTPADPTSPAVDQVPQVLSDDPGTSAPAAADPAAPVKPVAPVEPTAPKTPPIVEDSGVLSDSPEVAPEAPAVVSPTTPIEETPAGAPEEAAAPSAVDPNIALKDGNDNVVEGQIDPQALQQEEQIQEVSPIAQTKDALPQFPPKGEAVEESDHKTVSSEKLISPANISPPTTEEESEKSEGKSSGMPLKIVAVFLIIAVLAAAGILAYLLLLA